MSSKSSAKQPQFTKKQQDLEASGICWNDQRGFAKPSLCKSTSDILSHFASGLNLDVWISKKIQVPNNRNQRKIEGFAKGGPHDSCGTPFAKRRFGNFSKLPWSCQQRQEVPKSCCLALIPTVCHTISSRYPHLEIRSSSKWATTWTMWSSLSKTRFPQLFHFTTSIYVCAIYAFKMLGYWKSFNVFVGL